MLTWNISTLSGYDRYSAHMAHGFVIVPTPLKEKVSSRMGFVDNLGHPFESLELGFGKVSRPIWDKALKCIKIHFFFGVTTFPLPAFKMCHSLLDFFKYLDLSLVILASQNEQTGTYFSEEELSL